MKYVKILGLAAIAAAALMAFVGASSASATVLCKTNTTPCSEMYLSGQKIESHLKAGTKAVLQAGFATVECSESNVNGKTTNTGSSTETVDGPIETLDFVSSSCNCETKTLKNGELEIHWIEGTMNGTLTAKGSEVTVNCFGTDCVYGPGASGMDIGTLTASTSATTPAVLDANATMTKISGGFFCANEASWTATYEVTNPKPLYIAGS